MNIIQFCEKNRIQDYTINSDGIIDVNGSVNLCRKLGDMKKLPVKFGKVSGYFDCGKNILTTLEGCPKYIGDGFLGNIITHHILGNVKLYIYYDVKQRIVI